MRRNPVNLPDASTDEGGNSNNNNNNTNNTNNNAPEDNSAPQRRQQQQPINNSTATTSSSASLSSASVLPPRPVLRKSNLGAGNLLPPHPSLSHPTPTTSSTNTQNNQNKSSLNLMSGPYTTIPPSQQFLNYNNNNQQQQMSSVMQPRVGGLLAPNPFPQFTKASGANNNAFGAVPTVSSSIGGVDANHQKHYSDNVVMDTFLEFPSSSSSSNFSRGEEKGEETENNNNKNDDDDNSSNKNNNNLIDKFSIRLYGPKYFLYPNEKKNNNNNNNQEEEEHQEHRLLLFLHGAGMSLMSFHLVACAMLGIDLYSSESSVIKVNENESFVKKDFGKQDEEENDKEQQQQQQQQESSSSVSANINNMKKPSRPPRLIIASFDYRGHGKTKIGLSSSSNENENENTEEKETENKTPPMDIENFASDAIHIISRLFDIGKFLHEKKNNNNKKDSSPQQQKSNNNFWAPDHSVCLIGHSVGGSVATIISSRPEWRQRVFGLVLLDIVEGTALESVRHMPDFLKRRPDRFRTINEAITWFIRTGGMRNIEHAKISVPSLLKKVTIPTTTASNVDDDASSSSSSSEQKRSPTENNSNNFQVKEWYEWIANLQATEPFWHTWFGGMDGRFLHAIAPRLLCLATRDTLDKDLTVAHMQGQFQLEIFRDCGHYLMEDQPEIAASVFLRFLFRIEQQTEKLRAVYMKKYGNYNYTNSPSASSSTSPSSSSSAASASAVPPGAAYC